MSTSRLQVWVQEELRDRIERQAAQLGLTVSEYVVGAIAQRLQHDADRASRIEVPARDRAWFFELLADRSPLPDEWERAAAAARDIED